MKNEYKIVGDITEIYLRKRDGTKRVAIIDTDKLEDVKRINVRWSSYKDANTEYVSVSPRGNKGKALFLHQVIVGIHYKKQIDHINHNGLDNRFSNLRVVTVAENQQNRISANKNSKSGHRGVYWRESTKKWVTQIDINKTRFRLGSYIEIKDAIDAVDKFLDSRNLIFN